MYRSRGFGDLSPVTTAVGAPAAGSPVAPAGYWTNPANSSQWLSQSDAAKVGGLCMQGPIIGKYTVAGNFSNSVLACENLPCQSAALIYGGIAAGIFLLAPGGWKWASLAMAYPIAVSCLFTGGM